MSTQSEQALNVALGAVEQLTLQQRQKLTARLLSVAAHKENLIVLFLRGLPPQKRARLAMLMDKNNNERLNRRE